MDGTITENLIAALLRKDKTHLPSYPVSYSDWEKVVNSAEKHGLSPLLFFQLRVLNRLSDIPHDVQRQLSEAYLKGSARGTHFSIELTRILASFNKKGISVIVLKGPHLAEEIYKDWAVRPMCDFDLLVRVTDVSQANEALKDLGYEASKDFITEIETRYNAHSPIFAKKGGFFVELHWNLELPTGPFSIDLNGVWERAEKTNIAGIDTLVLSNEDLLLHLCIHMSYRHHFALGILPLCDIAETIHCLKKRIDWGKLLKLAEGWRVQRCLYLTLYLSKELLGAEVQADFLRKLQPHDFSTSIAAAATEQIFCQSHTQLPMNHNLSQLWGNKTLWDKGMIFMRKAFPSREFLSAMYAADPTSKRVYFYYLVRLKDLLSRYGKTVFTLLKKDKDVLAQVHREEQGNMLVQWLTSRQPSLAINHISDTDILTMHASLRQLLERNRTAR